MGHFSSKMSKERRRRSMAIVIGPIFVHKNWKRGYWQHLVSTGQHTAKATLDVLHPGFGYRIISRRADIVWPPRSCDLTSLDYYLYGALKVKCYADKPETIDALKDNIHEMKCALKLNRSCRLLHGQPRQPFEWNYFPLQAEELYFQIKKQIWENIQ